MGKSPENRIVTPIKMAVGLSGAGVVAIVRFLGSAGEVNAQNPLDIPTPVGVIAAGTPNPTPVLPNGVRMDITPTLTPTATKEPTPTSTATATPTLTSLESAKQTAADLERKVATEKERVATQAMIDRLNQQFEALQKTPTPAVPTATFFPTSTSTPTAQEKLQKIVADLEQEAADARVKAAANDRIDRLNNQIAALSNTPTPKPDLAATKTALINQAAKEVAAIQATAIASAQPSPTPVKLPPSATPSRTPAGGPVSNGGGGSEVPWGTVAFGVVGLALVGSAVKFKKQIIIGTARGIIGIARILGRPVPPPPGPGGTP